MQDMSELEAMLRQSIYPPDMLRDAHNVVKAFRAVLFTDDASLADADARAALPHITLLLHCFSRLPPDVPHPHVRTNVSAKQYSQWMDQHSATDVIASIASTAIAKMDHPVARVMMAVLA